MEQLVTSSIWSWKVFSALKKIFLLQQMFIPFLLFELYAFENNPIEFLLNWICNKHRRELKYLRPKNKHLFRPLLKMFHYYVFERPLELLRLYVKIFCIELFVSC